MIPHPHLGLSRSLKLLALSIGLAALFHGPISSAGAGKAAAPLSVANAASYATTVAPGSIGALFSSDMTTLGGQAAVSIPLPTTLAGLSVKVAGITAYLFYAGPSQINLQIPGGVASGNATVEVFATGLATPVSTGSVTVAESAPGVFTFNQLGTFQAAALNSDSSINSDFDVFPGSHPEASGIYVSIFATGVGRTSPLVPDGQAAPGVQLAIADAPTTVNIGGVAAQVLYSGLAPGYVGLWQINAVLPGSLPTNLSTSLAVELKTRQSQPTTIAVANSSDLTTVNGTVVSALTGSPIVGADVSFQKMPNGTVRHALTNVQGQYQFKTITGDFAMSAAASGYIPASQNATVPPGQGSTLPPIALTLPLAAGQYRVVVSWQGGLDLDAHLTGPATTGRFHVWWNGETDLKTPATAQFDRDDLTGLGPETVTFTPQAGVYRFSVQNYSNRDLNGSMGFTLAKVSVRVYAGNQQLAFVTAPSGGGTLWKVFELNGGQLNLINQLSDEPDPSNIKTLF